MMSTKKAQRGTYFLSLGPTEKVPAKGDTVMMVGAGGTLYAITVHHVKAQRTTTRGLVLLEVEGTRRVVANA